MLQRDAELAALDRGLARVRAGAGEVIVVEGPAGIGKSSLLAAVARGAAAGGVQVLRAWGSPLEQDAGWGIARQLFAPLRGGPEWGELTVGAAALAGRALDGDAPPALAGDAAHAAVHGLTWLACGLAERSPALLVVDDVHWADAPSLRWLVQLTRQLGELPLGILCAARSGEPPAHPALTAELLAAAPGPAVRPPPLGPEAVEVLVAARLPGPAPGFVHACHAVTAGNPFLVGALLTQVATQGLPPSDEVGARLTTFGAEQVARAVGQQLARLPAGCAELARAFAVLGRGTSLRCAAEVAAVQPGRAPALADALRAAGLLAREDHRYALVHPLLEAALYDALPPAARASRHAAAAAVLARDRADPEAVALHLLRSEPAGAAGTVTALRDAAARAGQRGAPESAVAFLRRALAEPPPDPAVEADVRSELGLTLAAHVLPDAPPLLSQAVELATTPSQRARIALSGGRALGLAGHFDAAMELCRRGLAAVDDVRPDLAARLTMELACNAALNASHAAAAQRWLAEPEPPDAPPRRPVARAALRAFGGVRAAADDLAALTAPGSPDVPAPPAPHGAAPDPDADSLVETMVSIALIMCGAPDAARARCDALIDVARPRGWRIALAHGSFLRAIALLQLGRIRDAEADARDAFTFKLSHSPPAALVWSLFPLVEALTELDDPDGADEALALAERGGPVPPGMLGRPLLLQARAHLRLTQRRPADAHADLASAAAEWAALGIAHPGLATWRVDDVEALVGLGDMGTARQLATEHLALAETVASPGPLGAGLRASARTAVPGEAVLLLGRAVDLLDGTPAVIERVRCLVDLGAALRRANRRSAAREPLRCALDLAQSGGMRLLARRARHELQASGARPRRDARSGADALTAAEHRVVQLAAQGRSNPEIAQELYVTRRTVETHLTHAFQKLGVSTRAALAEHVGPPR